MRASKILSVLVDNKPGTLFRVTHLVRLMRLNIEGLTLGVTNGGDTCRMTFTLNGDDRTVEHVARQLMKVIDVIEAHTYGPQEVTARELALVSLKKFDPIQFGEEERQRLNVIDRSTAGVVVQIVGTAGEIDEFVRRAGESNVIDIARTGVAALPKEKQNA
ncbi:MAG: acetolactate synthase small subunit [Thaumarchaeota archaeon]|nr:acetolactate synthase small subunit [Nitrososphaerota archaeon]MBI3022873.1 acetolactate synthase small subunit [Nitrososphaerota archaeon]MCS4539135.1 acetolactate synthase small subunit [Nitrososphaerota archaeon]